MCCTGSICTAGQLLTRAVCVCVPQDCWAANARDRPDFFRLRLWLQDPFLELSSPQGDCVICLGAPAAAALIPCGHRCVCPDHARGLVGGACPICMGVVTDFLGVYDS